MKRLLTYDDVAELLRLSKSSLRRLVRAGDFPEPLRVTPRRVAWTEDAVEEWLERRLEA